MSIVGGACVAGYLGWQVLGVSWVTVLSGSAVRWSVVCLFSVLVSLWLGRRVVWGCLVVGRLLRVLLLCCVVLVLYWQWGRSRGMCVGSRKRAQAFFVALRRVAFRWVRGAARRVGR